MGRAHIHRAREIKTLRWLFSFNPVVAILGPRQVGKTTLAADLARAMGGEVHRFDLEDPQGRQRLEEPMMALRPLRGLIVLDEVHRAPEVFRVLRVLADRPDRPARFLVLGSASEELLRQTSETLAGRIAFHDLRGFSLDEVGTSRLDRLWLRGGFPLSFLAPGDGASLRWRQGFVRTFLERDLPGLGVGIPPETLGRFWTMLAHSHAQTWNGAELARAFGVGESTVRRYLDTLASTFMVRILRPWSENLAKRQVRSPKVYLADSGVLHELLSIESEHDLLGHAKVGASWEGFALAEVVRRLGAREDECHFWATHTGAELDLLVVRGNRRYGFEIKRTAEPRVTKSMRIAMEDLRLPELVVIHAGKDSFPMSKGIRAVALARVLEDLKPLP